LGQLPKYSIRVSATLYPVAALSAAADQLASVCTADFHVVSEGRIEVTLTATSEQPVPHLVDEYLTRSLMAMIEQRSGLV